MKLKKILNVFPLTWIVIYFDTSEHDSYPEWEGWSDDVPYWLADAKIVKTDDNRVYHDPDQAEKYKQYGLVLIVEEPD